MSRKFEAAKAIVDELIAAQSRPLEEPKGSPIPPVLWIGDGRSIKASHRTYELIRTYAALLIAENVRLTVYVSEQEVLDGVGHAVANIADDLGITQLRQQPGDQLASDIDERTELFLNKRRSSLSYYFGCSLLHGTHIPCICLGPVTIEPRKRWVARERQEGRLTNTSARRILATWEGRRVRPRRNTVELANERAILNAIGSAAFVCSVTTGKLSTKSAAPKVTLAARLGLLSVALLWGLPSRVLSEMRLGRDGLRHLRQYAIGNGSGFYGSSWSAEGSLQGYYVGPDWLDDWRKFRPYCEPIAEALTLFVDPEDRSPRPKVLKRLFMALWWFHEACREQADLLAIAKFASSMDALALGGRADGIKSFINLRVGRALDEPWLKDGRSPEMLVHEIYEITRNQVLHGSIKDFDKDWSALRSSAEFIARQCLIASLDWMKSNPNEANPKKILAT